MQRATLVVVGLLVAFLAFAPAAQAGESAGGGMSKMTAVTPACAAASTLFADDAPAAEATPAPEDQPFFNEEGMTEAAVTCGSWLYYGCCLTQTRERRICRFNSAEWWYEYRCVGVCHF